MYPYGLVGNCQISALIGLNGAVDWMCAPRPDSPPVFGRLLDPEGGHFTITSTVRAEELSTQQRYLPNTNILLTTVSLPNGDAFQITDFCPRFEQYGRIYRPAALFRLVEPLQGIPVIRVSCRPVSGWDKNPVPPVRGSNHLRYDIRGELLRLLTNMPLTYLCEETPIALTQKFYFGLTWGLGIEDDLVKVAHDFLEQTARYWRMWVKNCSVPLLHQREVIRSALALKLHCFEDTGAILAALTTSLPEQPGGQRNWDYRYCWLRDAFFVIKALNRLGATQTMENYIHYITNVAVDGERPLRPVYGIVPSDPLEERIATDLAGFQGMGPVRVGNQAAEQMQHDAYGSVILGAAQMFIDERLPRMGDAALFHRLEPLGTQAMRFAFEPDAGPWEYRGRQRVHTHSATMCWVACDRLASIAHRLRIPDRAAHWRQQADKLREEILRRAWSGRTGAIAGALDHDELDASVLLLPDLGILQANDPRFLRTFDAIGKQLMRNGFVMRYTSEDDFGPPETAFLACQFWYIDALAALGRKDEAREMFADLLTRRNAFGLLSEDIHPTTGQLWGNLPQTYSMAGIVNSGRILSRSWQEAWARETP